MTGKLCCPSTQSTSSCPQAILYSWLKTHQPGRRFTSRWQKLAFLRPFSGCTLPTRPISLLFVPMPLVWPANWTHSSFSTYAGPWPEYLLTMKKSRRANRPSTSMPSWPWTSGVKFGLSQASRWPIWQTRRRSGQWRRPSFSGMDTCCPQVSSTFQGEMIAPVIFLP